MNGTMNKVILIGNLGDDIKMHHFDDQNSIGKFSIATTESYTSKETGEKVSQTEWHNVVVRNKLADICSKYTKKGDKVYIEGKLKTRKYTDSNNMERFITEIHANEVVFLTTKNNSNSENNNYGQESNTNASSYTQNQDPNDGLPF